MLTVSPHTDRIKNATPPSINRKIEKKTWERIASYVGKNTRDISKRIDELEKEWDIERYLGINMSTLAITGIALTAISRNKAWLILPGVVLGFFMQHAIQGWCPPLPLLRKLHIRTAKEIEQEKYALKVLRGDFNDLQNISAPEIQQLINALKRI